MFCVNVGFGFGIGVIPQPPSRLCECGSDFCFHICIAQLPPEVLLVFGSGANPALLCDCEVFEQSKASLWKARFPHNAEAVEGLFPVSNLGGHPKPAIAGHFKTGHRETA